MSNVLWFITYQLKKDVSIEDFLRASESVIQAKGVYFLGSAARRRHLG